MALTPTFSSTSAGSSDKFKRAIPPECSSLTVDFSSFTRVTSLKNCPPVVVRLAIDMGSVAMAQVAVHWRKIISSFMLPA